MKEKKIWGKFVKFIGKDEVKELSRIISIFSFKYMFSRKKLVSTKIGFPFSPLKSCVFPFTSLSFDIFNGWTCWKLSHFFFLLVLLLCMFFMLEKETSTARNVSLHLLQPFTVYEKFSFSHTFRKFPSSHISYPRFHVIASFSLSLSFSSFYFHIRIMLCRCVKSKESKHTRLF